ncbi:MAG: hypothetical protein L0154_05895 [Chloroflexi bacterium]|nr:hypothetical protein [Chloroflexota bacterium]
MRTFVVMVTTILLVAGNLYVAFAQEGFVTHEGRYLSIQTPQSWIDLRKIDDLQAYIRETDNLHENFLSSTQVLYESAQAGTSDLALADTETSSTLNGIVVPNSPLLLEEIDAQIQAQIEQLNGELLITQYVDLPVGTAVFYRAQTQRLNFDIYGFVDRRNTYYVIITARRGNENFDEFSEIMNTLKLIDHSIVREVNEEEETATYIAPDFQITMPINWLPIDDPQLEVLIEENPALNSEFLTVLRNSLSPSIELFLIEPLTAWNMSVVVLSLDMLGVETLEEAKLDIEAQLRLLQAEESNIEVPIFEEIEIPAGEALRWDLVRDSQNILSGSDVRLHSVQIGLIHEGNSYTVTFTVSADAFEDMEPVIEEAIESIKFKE